MKTLLSFSLLTAFLFTQFTSYAQAQYVIPVVVHILHTGGPENISDAQVYDAIKNLNDDFNKRNADTADVIPAFSNNIANMQIEFRLAKLDPNGECTNGIERIYSNQTFQGQSHFSKINQWPPAKYMNIWVYAVSGPLASVPPYSANFIPATDGVPISHSFMGTIGTGSIFAQHTLTHQVADYLGLLHLEGNYFDCGEDSVADTPLATFQYTCDMNAVSCDSTGPQNVQNFMTFSYCSSMFTNGQKARVHNNLNTYANRKTLHTQANLIATGTNTNSQSACAPKANFFVAKPFACVGDSVRIVDISYNGQVTNRQWQFADANISTSSDSVVYVVFNNPGYHTIRLDVSNTAGNTAMVKQAVYIANTQALNTPYHTSFEGANGADDWAWYNYDDDVPQFDISNTGALTGNSCIVLNNRESNVEQNFDELFSPRFDCSALTNETAKLYFWYAWATRNANASLPQYDSIVVYASKNCGNSWTSIYRDGTNNVTNAGYDTGSFVPSSLAHWKKVEVTIPNTSLNNFRVNGVNFKIRVYGSSNSNNFYLDDFAIGAEPTVGIEEANALAGVNLMPNPFADKLQLSNVPNGVYELSVSNLQGQMVLQQKIIAEGNVNVDLAAQPAGVYLVSLQSGEVKVTIRAVKQ